MTPTATRSAKLQTIIDDLQTLSVPDKRRYAVEENLAFFEAAKSRSAFIRWLFARAPKLRGADLLELSDLLPQWEEELHSNLMRMYKQPFPGLITPLRDAIVEFIIVRRPRVTLDIGCGAMELERQVICELARRQYSGKLLFLGMDSSEVTLQLAMRNLEEIGDYVQIVQVSQGEQLDLRELKGLATEKHVIVLWPNSALNIAPYLPPKSVDLAFHCRFRHHLSADESRALDQAVSTVAATWMELGDYKSWFQLIPQFLATFKYPVLLNGAILSRLREKSKPQIEGQHVRFHPKTGSYLCVNAAMAN